mmetsp:Transcript_54920/g.131170  ORF Transcript_54920/g.131170 Transcript_54920/m.131170 type:complete len:258 (+) Transcript_54920:298-1071(+)
MLLLPDGHATQRGDHVWRCRRSGDCASHFAGHGRLRGRGRGRRARCRGPALLWAFQGDGDHGPEKHQPADRHGSYRKDAGCDDRRDSHPLRDHHAGMHRVTDLLVQGPVPRILLGRPDLCHGGLHHVHYLPHFCGPQPGERRCYGLHVPQHAPLGQVQARPGRARPLPGESGAPLGQMFDVLQHRIIHRDPGAGRLHLRPSFPHRIYRTAPGHDLLGPGGAAVCPAPAGEGLLVHLPVLHPAYGRAVAWYFSADRPT